MEPHISVFLIAFNEYSFPHFVAYSNREEGEGEGPVFKDNLPLPQSTSLLFLFSFSIIWLVARSFHNLAGFKCQFRWIYPLSIQSFYFWEMFLCFHIISPKREEKASRMLDIWNMFTHLNYSFLLWKENKILYNLTDIHHFDFGT